MSAFYIGARVKHFRGRLGTVRRLQEENGFFTMVRFDQADDDGEVLALVLTADLVLAEDQTPPANVADLPQRLPLETQGPCSRKIRA